MTLRPDPEPRPGMADEERQASTLPDQPGGIGGRPMDPDHVWFASVKRRERLVGEVDLARETLPATEARLRRTQAALDRASRSTGYRLERSVRRLLRPLADRARAATGRDRPAPAEAEVEPAVVGDPTADFRVSMSGRLTRTEATEDDPIRVVLIGHVSPERDDCTAVRTDRVAAGLTKLGLEVSVVDGRHAPDVVTEDGDVILVLCPSAGEVTKPRRHITAAWVGGEPMRWIGRSDLDDIDIILVADEATRMTVEAHRAKAAWVAADPSGPAGAQDLLDALLRWVMARRVAIHIGAPTWEVAAGWGDTPFARDVQRAFERRGWPATVHVAADQDSASALRADVAVHIAGVRAAEVRPWQTTVLWIISHPDAVRRETCLRYDLIAVASDGFLELLRDTLGPHAPPMLALHQATDPDRFFPEAGGPAHELLFVGSARRVERTVTAALAGTDHDFAVYGRNWTADRVDPRHHRGDWIPNDGLRRHYAAAAIVLSDALADMRDEGFIPNRVYDALASGAFVISEEVAGMTEEFDGGVVTFSDRADLLDRIEYFLERPAERRALADTGRRAVLARHTFGHRVDALLSAVTPLLDRHG